MTRQDKTETRRKRGRAIETETERDRESNTRTVPIISNSLHGTGALGCFCVSCLFTVPLGSKVCPRVIEEG